MFRLKKLRTKSAIRALDDDAEGNKDYIFLPSERVKIIVCYIIHSKKPIYVEQLMNVCQVSRNTIFNDIHLLIRQLHEYNLTLTYAPKIGYKIEGDVIHVRALYFLFFDALRPLLESGMLSFFDRQEIYRNSAVKAPCFSCVEETAQASWLFFFNFL